MVDEFNFFISFFYYDRGDMKLVSHGKKLNKFGACHVVAEPFVINYGLMPLCHILYDYAYKGLILAFVERWHRETNTFHITVGEVIVTLDDVFALLHLPIMRQFCPNETLDFDATLKIVMDLLGVQRIRVSFELMQCHGPHVRLSWLKTFTVSVIRTNSGSFSQGYIWCVLLDAPFLWIRVLPTFVSYLHLFTDLQSCGRYAQGVVALSHLYQQLRDVSFAQTKQLAKYLTLLQVKKYL